MDPQFATLISLLKGMLTLAGPLVGFSLTAFTFLVTRTIDKVDRSQEPGKSLRVMGPFCFLFSSALSLYAFVCLAFMSRLNEAAIQKTRGEFASWLSPVHLLAMVLFLAILFLGIGLYYVTRLWLLEAGLSEHSRRRTRILQTMLLWIFLAPLLLFFYIAMVLRGIWVSDMGDAWSIAYIVSAMTFLAIGVPALSARWRLDKSVWIMRSTLIMVLLFSGVQVAQNIAWANGSMSIAFDMLMILSRMLSVALVSTMMLGTLVVDYRKARDGDAATPLA
ncbi:MAG: hypothetical protein JNL08_07010 [Planctomycetes bacterium]|nr:hypothetical protein [Planctomycetota bacterium]